MTFADTAATESLGVATAKAATAISASPSPIAKATAAKVGSAEAPSKSTKTAARFNGAMHQKHPRSGDGDHQTNGFDSWIASLHGFVPWLMLVFLH